MIVQSEPTFARRTFVFVQRSIIIVLWCKDTVGPKGQIRDNSLIEIVAFQDACKVEEHEFYLL